MSVDGKEVHDLLERLSSLMRADIRAICSERGIQPVQLEALEFLTKCNRYSDTPQAVTEFLGLTKGTVSQSLKVLERKGFLCKQVDEKDKRIVHLKPTASGRKLVAQTVPVEALMNGFDALSFKDRQTTIRILRMLLRSTQYSNGLKTFALCKTCRFNQQRKGGYFCNLTQQPLSKKDVELLCREHEYRAVASK